MICYHVTTEDRLASILKRGLVPNSANNRSARKVPHIMLSLYPFWNLYRNWKKNKGLVLIEIKYPQITREMFDNDPEGLAYEKVIHPKYFRAVVRFEVIK